MTTLTNYDLDYQAPAPGSGKYLFLDLDETLIHYSDFEKSSYSGLYEGHEFQDRLMLMRPEAHELLSICRDWADKVVMCTFAGDIYARIANEAFELGFQEDEFITVGLLSTTEDALGPEGVLIDNLPASHENTAIKLYVLGIPDERLIEIPDFSHPEYKNLANFLEGLPMLLEQMS
jgi:hypothetical protein